MSYREVWDAMKQQPHDGIIQREYDGAFIPFDPDNVDYQEYMQWLNDGNNPNAHDVPYVAPYDKPKEEEPVVQTKKASPKF
jgi:hypothetical protein